MSTKAERSQLAMQAKYERQKAFIEEWIVKHLPMGSRLLLFQSQNDYSHYVSKYPLSRDHYTRAIIYMSDLDGVLYFGSKHEERTISIKLPWEEEYPIGFNVFGMECLRLAWFITGGEKQSLYSVLRAAKIRMNQLYIRDGWPDVRDLPPTVPPCPGNA